MTAATSTPPAGAPGRPAPPGADLALRCEEARSWPLPGSGRTAARLERLAATARDDVVVGRLVEAHADAVAIMAELGGPPVSAGDIWGVWAAGPGDAVQARLDGGTWRLTGTKPWCSGATVVSHALVDAATAQGGMLFAVALAAPGARPGPPSWVNAGMAAADTRSVSFVDAPAAAIGSPGAYLARPGFWSGAVGVAACWHGGTVAVAAPLYRAAARSGDAHLHAHLGAVHAALDAGAATLRWAAERIDAQPSAAHFVTATSARSVVERHATEVIDRVGRALGPGPLAHDHGHARRVADLAVYIRQHHGERDLAELGRRVAGGGPPWP